MPRVAHLIAESETAFAQQIRSGRHQLTADEPRANGGADTGPSPYALLLASLGACTSITLRMYAARKGFELGKISVELDFIKDETGRIERESSHRPQRRDRQHEKLVESAEKTPVTLTLKRGTEIATRIHSESV